MLKLTSVFMFVVIFLNAAVPGQTLSKAPQNEPNGLKLRELLTKETENIKREGKVIDKKKMQKTPRQTMRNGLTGKEKTFLIVFIAGMAVLVALLIKYGKNCLRYENDCSPSADGCYCEEYEQEEDEQRRMLVPSFQKSVPQFGRTPVFNKRFSF